MSNTSDAPSTPFGQPAPQPQPQPSTPQKTASGDDGNDVGSPPQPGNEAFTGVKKPVDGDDGDA